MVLGYNKKVIASSIFMSLFLLGCYNKSNVTKTETTIDNSGLSQTITSQTSLDKNDTITHIKVQNSVSSYNNRITMNGGTIDFKNDKMYINGKEVDIDTQQGIIISSDNNNTFINGQSIKTTQENLKDIKVTLSGQTVKIPVNSLNRLSSNFHITQKCSDSNNSYFLIDSALDSYILKDKAKQGELILSTGNYTIKGKINVELYTPALQQINYNSYGSMNISCVDKSNFSLEHNGVGKIVIDNINTKSVKVIQSGSGVINLQGNHIDNLYAENNGVGAINISVKVKKAQLNNSGVGMIQATEIGELDSENSGIGAINVEVAHKIVRQEKNPLESMFDNDEQ